MSPSTIILGVLTIVMTMGFHLVFTGGMMLAGGVVVAWPIMRGPAVRIPARITVLVSVVLLSLIHI